MKVLFLCRGSARDGIGHVTRSRTVARAMSHVAQVKMVAIGDSHIENLLVGRGLDYSIVAEDAEAMCVFRKFEPYVAVLDLTNLSVPDFHEIQQSRWVVSLSPIFNRLLEVDLVFHRSSVLGPDWPFCSMSPLIRRGLRYAVVSEHCRRISDAEYQLNLEAGPLSVAVSMGGADAANKTLEVLKVLKRVSGELLLWVLLGEGYAHSYEDLVNCMQGSKHEIILAKTNNSMWRILSMCSLVLLAGGTTTYEAAYAGLPSVNMLKFKEHFFLVQELVEKGACCCAGSSDDLGSVIEYLNANRCELDRMRRKSKRLIDGFAADRIAREIRGL